VFAPSLKSCLHGKSCESFRSAPPLQAALERGLLPDNETLKQLVLDPELPIGGRSPESLSWPEEPLRFVLISKPHPWVDKSQLTGARMYIYDVNLLLARNYRLPSPHDVSLWRSRNLCALCSHAQEAASIPGWRAEWATPIGRKVVSKGRHTCMFAFLVGMLCTLINPGAFIQCRVSVNAGREPLL
jgi:hypothetical protein